MRRGVGAVACDALSAGLDGSRARAVASMSACGRRCRRAGAGGQSGDPVDGVSCWVSPHLPASSRRSQHFGNVPGSCTIRCGFASTLGESGSPSSDLRLARARRPSEPRADRPHRSYAMSALAVTQDQPNRLPADTVAGERPTATPGRFARREATQEQFRLRCADAHPVGCDVELVSSSRDDLVSRACSHGAIAHGFTPVWYSPGRVAAIAAEVAQTGRVRRAGTRP